MIWSLVHAGGGVQQLTVHGGEGLGCKELLGVNVSARLDCQRLCASNKQPSSSDALQVLTKCLVFLFQLFFWDAQPLPLSLLSALLPVCLPDALPQPLAVCLSMSADIMINKGKCSCSMALKVQSAFQVTPCGRCKILHNFVPCLGRIVRQLSILSTKTRLRTVSSLCLCICSTHVAHALWSARVRTSRTSRRAAANVRSVLLQIFWQPAASRLLLTARSSPPLLLIPGMICSFFFSGSVRVWAAMVSSSMSLTCSLSLFAGVRPAFPWTRRKAAVWSPFSSSNSAAQRRKVRLLIWQCTTLRTPPLQMPSRIISMMTVRRIFWVMFAAAWIVWKRLCQASTCPIRLGCMRCWRMRGQSLLPQHCTLSSSPWRALTL